jgi:hypothetical protein
MDKAYLATTPMIVCALKKDKDPFKSREEEEEVLRQEYSYLSDIGILQIIRDPILLLQ